MYCVIFPLHPESYKALSIPFLRLVSSSIIYNTLPAESGAPDNNFLEEVIGTYPAVLVLSKDDPIRKGLGYPLYVQLQHPFSPAYPEYDLSVL